MCILIQGLKYLSNKKRTMSSILYQKKGDQRSRLYMTHNFPGKYIHHRKIVYTKK